MRATLACYCFVVYKNGRIFPDLDGAAGPTVAGIRIRHTRCVIDGDSLDQHHTRRTFDDRSQCTKESIG